jgi:ribonuclease HI
VINVLSPSPLFSSKIDNPAVKNGDTSLLQEETTDKKFDVEIWTDGACVYNGAKNAKAAWAFVSGEFEQAGLVTGKQTNNRGEAFAIYQALLWAAERGYKRIRLYTDSQITLHGVLKNPDKVRENRDIFLRIHQVSVKNKLEIDYQKVLGHAGDKNNERADKLANMLASSSAA